MTKFSWQTIRELDILSKLPASAGSGTDQYRWRRENRNDSSPPREPELQRAEISERREGCLYLIVLYNIRQMTHQLENIRRLSQPVVITGEERIVVAVKHNRD